MYKTLALLDYIITLSNTFFSVHVTVCLSSHSHTRAMSKLMLSILRSMAFLFYVLNLL